MTCLEAVRGICRLSFDFAKNVLNTVLAARPTITNDAQPSQTDTGERTTISGPFTAVGRTGRMAGSIFPDERKFHGVGQSRFTGTYEINGNTVTVIDGPGRRAR